MFLVTVWVGPCVWLAGFGMENYHGGNEKIVETEEDVVIDDLDAGSEAQEDSVDF